MKVAIVTFIRAYNYGAVLQAYALNKAIKDLGADCKVIDYYPEYFYNEYHFTNSGCRSFRLLPNKSVRRWIYNNSAYLKIRNRGNSFDKFIRKRICITDKQFHNYQELEKCEMFDIYISGSDQVWKPSIGGFDKAYYLQFCKPEKRFSYAASFGFTEIPDEYYNEYKYRLNNWNRYSVRERSGINIIKELTGKTAVCCCDPTLLLSADEWCMLLKIKKQKPYILLYFVGESQMLFDSAKKLSNKYHMDVLCIHSNMQSKYFAYKFYRKYGFKNLSDCSPNKFVELFCNATFVLTNSFHGTVFSVLFHKQFLCQNTLNDGSINKRATELLDNLEINNRFLDVDDLEKISETIDWRKTDKRIRKLRCDGLNYLKSIVKE